MLTMEVSDLDFMMKSMGETDDLNFMIDIIDEEARNPRVVFDPKRFFAANG